MRPLLHATSLVAATLLVVGCAAPPAKVAEVEQGGSFSTRTCAVRREILRAFQKDAGGAKAPAASGPRRVSIDSGPTPEPFSVAFGVAAPATAIVRAADAFGSGVVIDRERGLVLTNFHVVQPAQDDDFGFKVKVEFGRLLDSGRMVRDERSFDGVVVKADPVRDLAIVKVASRPDDLVEVSIARRTPHVGDPVLAIGQAGLGMLWGARACHVADVGDPIEDTSLFAAVDCTLGRPGDDPSEVARYAAECERSRDQLRSFLEHMQQGLAIQTNCSLMEGDSGGPLVNTSGELVGLNQSVRSVASLHVHRDEVAEFVASIPDTPLVFLPDPFCEGVPNVVVDDADLDGTNDIVAAALPGYVEDSWLGPGHEANAAFFFDLDQDASKNAAAASGVPFDPEVAFVQRERTLYVHYDTDDDGRFDTLLVDKQGDGKVDRGFRIDDQGALKDAADLRDRKLFDTALVPPSHSFARFGALVKLVGRAHMAEASLAVAETKATAPKISLPSVGDGYVWDWDGDDRVDTLIASGVFGRARLYDPTGASFEGMRSGDGADDLLRHPERLKPSVTLVMRGDTALAQYDEGRDGEVDIVSWGPINAPDFTVATHALRLSARRDPVELPDAVGRLLVRSSLADLDEPPAALATMAASDDALGSFPDVRALDPGGFRFSTGPSGVERHALVYQDRETFALMLDLDRSTKDTALSTATDLVEARSFDAELVVIAHRGLAWAYYDTDNDRRVDLVTFESFDSPGLTRAFRLPFEAEAELIAAPGGGLIQPDRFKFVSPKKVREMVSAHLVVELLKR